MKKKTTKPEKPQLGAWVRVLDKLPELDAVIACCAEHKTGVPMYWAGRIVSVTEDWATMEILGYNPCRFILTYDTWWLKLPMAPPRF